MEKRMKQKKTMMEKEMTMLKMLELNGEGILEAEPCPPPPYLGAFLAAFLWLALGGAWNCSWASSLHMPRCVSTNTDGGCIRVSTELRAALAAVDDPKAEATAKAKARNQADGSLLSPEARCSVISPPCHGVPPARLSGGSPFGQHGWAMHIRPLCEITTTRIQPSHAGSSCSSCAFHCCNVQK